jgi:hypothetical protein
VLRRRLPRIALKREFKKRENGCGGRRLSCMHVWGLVLERGLLSDARSLTASSSTPSEDLNSERTGPGKQRSVGVAGANVRA